MSALVSRRLFTTDEFYRMADCGIFSEDDQVELLRGEIVWLYPKSSRHIACVMRLNQELSSRFDNHAIISVQNPVRLDTYSEPLPDLALLQWRDDFYRQAHPEPKDILLIIEVAETSATYDRAIKLPLYAKAGIPEVWLVDLTGESLRACTKPSPDGYAEMREFRRGDSIKPQSFPEVQIAITDILG